MLGSITNILSFHCRVPVIMPSWDQPCSVCGRRFIRLESHLPHCNERNGRDYSAFLVRSVVPWSAHGTCLLCERHFDCLDTHLRVSTSRRKIAPSNQLITGALCYTTSCLPSCEFHPSVHNSPTCNTIPLQAAAYNGFHSTYNTLWYPQTSHFLSNHLLGPLKHLKSGKKLTTCYPVSHH